MKKKLLILLISMLVLTACSSKNSDNIYQRMKEKGTITVAVSPDYPPYEFLDLSKKGQEQYVGADIELARYIANAMKLDLELKSMDFSDIPTAIRLKKYDLGISGFTYEEERAQQIQFSQSYDNSESTCQGLLVRKSEHDKFQKLSDFENKKIAVQNGSLQAKYLKEQLPEAKTRLVGKLDDAVLELQFEKVDAIAISCESAKGFMQNNDDLALSDVKFDIIDEEGMMVIMPKDEEDLLVEINSIIEEVLEKDLYSQWMEEASELAEKLGELD